MQRTSPVTVEDLTDDLARFAGFVMKTASGDAFQVAADLDLSMSQLRAMFILVNSAEQPALHELAAHIGLSVAATGRAVDGLVRNGLVTRTEDIEDRRVKRLAPTAAGTDAIERITASRRAGVARFVAEMTDREREDLSAALAPLLARTQQSMCAAPTDSEPTAPAEGAPA